MSNETDTFFDSSDAVRSAAELPHARQYVLDGPLDLEQGGQLSEVHVTYETYGTLNEARDNAILICHAVSGDSHVAAHHADDAPGWWDIVVGPGKPIDTDLYFVICPNCLGGCRGTTGPNSINPATGEPYGPDFPDVTIGDMVEVQHRLVAHLGISKLLAVVGGSMGGHQVLCWARRYPHHVRSVIPVATSARIGSQALAFDIVGRNAILQDPDFCGGRYYQTNRKPETGLAIARMIGHITYLSPEAMSEKFEADRTRPRDVPVKYEKTFSVGSYLGYQGTKFVERFDANSYLVLTMAMDQYDLGADWPTLAKALEPCVFRWLVVSFTSDWLFPPEQSRQIVHALIASNKPVTYCNVVSTCGHDAFLLPDDVASYGELIRAFLANLSGQPASSLPPARECGQALGDSSTSIFHPDHPQRLDYERIIELIDPSASVLDLGCGCGELLTELKARGHRTMGVELDELAILCSVRKGLDVVQADLNAGLSWYADKQFDCVVLSRTLQSIKDVESLVDEMLRVGRQCIVSFPNFAYHKLRQMLAEEGRAPEAAGVLKHHWYDTPNIRFFSLRDFRQFCDAKGIRVHRQIALDTEAGREITDDPNRHADLAIFVISR